MERFSSPDERISHMGNPAYQDAFPASSREVSSPGSAAATAERATHRIDFNGCGNPHQVEQDVKRRLTSEPGCQFSSLVVRRIRGGVCLEGVVEAGPCGDGIRNLVKQVAGVDEVLNHLVDCRS